MLVSSAFVFFKKTFKNLTREDWRQGIGPSWLLRWSRFLQYLSKNRALYKLLTGSARFAARKFNCRVLCGDDKFGVECFCSGGGKQKGPKELKRRASNSGAQPVPSLRSASGLSPRVSSRVHARR